MPFKKIGAGQCGTIYQDPNDLVVYKMDNLILNPEHLWNDYLMHTKVKEAFEELKITSVNVPRVFTYISTKNERWWQSAGSGILTSAQKSDILVSERILPLPKLVRETLVQRYGPERVNGKVLDSEKSGYCLVRVYLGDRRPRSRFFSLSNFNLTIDRIEALGLDAERFAHSLGEGLAVINWQAEIDGADLEWVLGSKASSGSSDVPLSTEKLLTLPPCTDTTEQTNGGDLKSLMSDMFLLDSTVARRSPWTIRAWIRSSRPSSITTRTIRAPERRMSQISVSGRLSARPTRTSALRFFAGDFPMSPSLSSTRHYQLWSYRVS